MLQTDERFIWHETIETQHTRRSFLSEIDPEVIATVQEWLISDRFSLPGGFGCSVIGRSPNFLEAEIFAPNHVRLVHLGVVANSEEAQALWERLGGASEAKPAEPWCGVSLDKECARDPIAMQWLGDFERCLACLAGVETMKESTTTKNPHAVALGRKGGQKSGGLREGAGRKPQYVPCPRCGRIVTKTQAVRGHGCNR